MKITTIIAAALAFTAGTAQAAIVVGPTVGGLATFTDTSTNRDWLKLNDFFNMSGTAMIAAATTAGFTVATRADVAALVASLPLDGTVATFNSYVPIVGVAPNRALIWGAYAPDPLGNLGWAFAFDNYSSWDFVDNVFPASGIANGAGSRFADENLWAYRDGTVPEPASWALMVTGFGLVGAATRRRKVALAA